jgi:hypothetical protein
MSEASNAIKCRSLNSPDNQTSKRILVLGSVGHSRRVTAHVWDNLPNDLNVADYDVVILNLMAYSSDNELASRVISNTLPGASQFSRLLFSYGSEVVTIGSPSTIVARAEYDIHEATWWLPIETPVHEEQGDQIRITDSSFAYYFDNLDRWKFFWTGKSFSRSEVAKHTYIHAVGLEAANIGVSLKSIAETRFHKPIGIKANLQLLDAHGDTVVVSSDIYWLPPTTRISHYEAVDLLLRERYGVSSEQTAPDWVSSYHLPRQHPIENEINEHEREIDRLEGQLVTARRRLTEETRFQQLLFERGEPLELIVRDALRELGAEVEEFTEQGKEDGRIASPFGDARGMLEIKGRTSSLKLGDVRQLDQWVRDAFFNEEWEGKGILIANMYSDTPLGQRGDPFPDNCVRLAKRSGYCLVKTSQVFRALLDHQREELDIEGFWETIFETDGVCPLPDLEPVSQGD